MPQCACGAGHLRQLVELLCGRKALDQCEQTHHLGGAGAECGGHSPAGQTRARRGPRDMAVPGLALGLVLTCSTSNILLPKPPACLPGSGPQCSAALLAGLSVGCGPP